VAASPAHTDTHSHGDGPVHHGGGHGHAAGKPHVVPLKVLFAVWASLMVLTAVTYLVTFVDLGDARLNLMVALMIATIKGTLVCLYFMHLRYDRAFHSVVFLGAILLATLFVSFALMDSNQYQTDITWQKDDLSPAPY
jgi:cytochrome c oxidase subunit IV